MIIRATAPANIALLKYWGRHPSSSKIRWPTSPSLSMTLHNARTVCEISELAPGAHAPTHSHTHGPHIVLPQEIDDLPARQRVLAHIKDIQGELARKLAHTHRGVIKSFQREDVGSIQIHTHNTFPAKCGLASSASSFAALTLALVAWFTQAHSWQQLTELGLTREVLALLAMRGSGSASRSFWGGYVSWLGGHSPEEQSLRCEAPNNFWCLSNTILVVSSKSKEVSSSEGHHRALHSPFHQPRTAHAPERHQMMIKALKSKDLPTLGYLSEIEAFEMHAVAMTAGITETQADKPGVNYWQDGTIEVLTWLRKLRSRGEIQAWATLDAGANVHVISAPEEAENIAKRARQDLSLERVIADHTGKGPTLEIF